MVSAWLKDNRGGGGGEAVNRGETEQKRGGCEGEKGRVRREKY